MFSLGAMADFIYLSISLSECLSKGFLASVKRWIFKVMGRSYQTRAQLRKLMQVSLERVQSSSVSLSLERRFPKGNRQIPGRQIDKAAQAAKMRLNSRQR
jgi:hypothetical protein